MNRFGLMVSVLVVGCGGGPRTPEALANQTYFWKIASSQSAFGACSDEPQFRMDNMALKFDANTFIVYKVAPDGKTAISQTCPRVDAATCQPSANPVVFTIANPELTFSSQNKTAFGTAGCMLLDTTTWTLVDRGPAGTLEITHVLSLVDNLPACITAEAQFKQQSPNKLGIEGCVVTFSFGLALQQ